MKKPLVVAVVGPTASGKTSLAIEIVQMCIGRVFDVDDILLNLIGGFCGFLG